MILSRKSVAVGIRVEKTVFSPVQYCEVMVQLPAVEKLEDCFSIFGNLMEVIVEYCIIDVTFDAGFDMLVKPRIGAVDVDVHFIGWSLLLEVVKPDEE